MARLASLPMYDLPEVRAATDAWWRGLALAMRRAGVPDVSERLDRRAEGARDWTAPDLLFSQTCGLPLVTTLAGRVRLVATPAYLAPGCAGSAYRSFLVARADDRRPDLAAFAGAVAAVNAPESHSGCNVLRALAAALASGGRFFARVVVTGSHAGSLAALAAGRADIAAIDCVIWALLQRHRPEALSGLRVLAASPPAPALPYVTAAGTSDDELVRLRAALLEALDDPALADARAALLLGGAEVLPAERYEAVRAMAARGAGLAEFAPGAAQAG